MQQLLSRNPVERFRQVLKAQDGSPLVSYRAPAKGRASSTYLDVIGRLSPALIRWLAYNNITYDVDNARKLQDGLVGYFTSIGNNSHGLTVDGKWGNQTQDALLNVLAQVPLDFDPTNMAHLYDLQLLSPLPVQQTVPDFGYKSTYDYKNSKIRNLGFNNYQGLLSFVKANGDDPFAKELLERFGPDTTLWKLQEVESLLGVSGKYRRNDFGDMTRSMSKWAQNANKLWDDRYNASRQLAIPIDDLAGFYEWATTNNPLLLDDYKNRNQQ